MIIDTTFLVHLFRQRQDAFEKGVELTENDVVQRVPAPVVMELSYGVERWGDRDERRKLENAMEMYPVVELTRELADKAGAMGGKADDALGGESDIDKVDPMVAAVADFYGEPVLTENVEHFEALGVEVETY
ncbi:PIN domain-containing protein [Salinirarus marinus]|uniref:PIN domain-containing protein n=1 Tax=Salinirarus marinus TaxID=3068310 RepID=UPI003C6BDB72